MPVEPGMPGKPLLNLCRLVRLVVVQDQMDVQFPGCLPVDLTEEAQELVLPVPGQALTNNTPVQYIQSGKQRRRAVSLVVMGQVPQRPLFIGKPG